jgi:ATP-dependent helicase/nuclease subunit A
MLRGSIMHRLLQSLPDVATDRRRAAAQSYLDRAANDFPTDDRAAMIDRVLAIIDAPRFAPLFTPGSRAEVPIVGQLTGARGGKIQINGQIDRLVVTPDEVLIADYKTNRPAPRRIDDIPPGYLEQLALYRALLEKIYPRRIVRAALIWTEIPDLMEISPSDLDRALEKVTSA